MPETPIDKNFHRTGSRIRWFSRSMKSARICCCAQLVLATYNTALLVRTVEAQKLNLQSEYPDLSYVLTR